MKLHIRNSEIDNIVEHAQAMIHSALARYHHLLHSMAVKENFYTGEYLQTPPEFDSFVLDVITRGLTETRNNVDHPHYSMLQKTKNYPELDYHIFECDELRSKSSYVLQQLKVARHLKCDVTLEPNDIDILTHCLVLTQTNNDHSS